MQMKAGNAVLVCGPLSRDAEYRLAGDKRTPLCKFGLKVDEKPAEDGSDRREAVWCNCTCWRNVAQAAAGFRKGDVVFAVGKLQEREYTGRDGEPAVSRELVCEAVFVMGRSEKPAPSSHLSAQSDFEEIVSDDDLPF